MSDEILSSVNAEPVANVEPQVGEQTEQNTPDISAEVEVAEPQQEKPVQSKEDNAQYASIRREAESKTRDKVISEMYGESHGIHTYSDYQNAIEAERVRAEATEKGHDPELYAKMSSMEQKLNNYEREKMQSVQEQSLASKPFYKEWEGEVKETAKALNTDYETAYTIMSQQRLPDILAKHEQDLKSAKDTAIKEYLAQKTKPQGTVESGGQSPVIEQSTPKTFADAKKNSIELLRSIMNK